MKTIGSANLSFSIGFKQKIQFPNMGFTSNVSDRCRRLWSAGKSLFGFSLAWFLSCKKVEPETKLRLCSPQQPRLRQVSDFQGCHSTENKLFFLESKMGQVGVIPDAKSKAKQVPKRVVDRRDVRSKGKVVNYI